MTTRRPGDHGSAAEAVVSVVTSAVTGGSS